MAGGAQVVSEPLGDGCSDCSSVWLQNERRQHRSEDDNSHGKPTQERGSRSWPGDGPRIRIQLKSVYSAIAERWKRRRRREGGSGAGTHGAYECCIVLENSICACSDTGAHQRGVGRPRGDLFLAWTSFSSSSSSSFLHRAMAMRLRVRFWRRSATIRDLRPRSRPPCFLPSILPPGLPPWPARSPLK